MAVLLGPNNEGKSNILRAMVVGFRAVAELSRFGGRPRNASHQASVRGRLNDFEFYDWTRDFPKALQESSPGASSKFELEFQLDSADLEAFRGATGHRLNGELKLRVLIGREGRAELKVVKRGPGNKGLNASLSKIASFVTSRVRLEYIPTSRTSESVLTMVRGEIRQAWRRLESSQEFADALEIIERALKDSLEPVEHRLFTAISEFIPDVSGVRLQSERSFHPSSVLGFDVLVDDGHLTSLSVKGDGVQSLIAISLSRALAQAGTIGSTGQALVLAVEEPEAHLHPGAIHKLAGVLREIAETDQVILTTHSPILVNRSAARENILVRDSRAAPATSLDEVRESLGVQLPDNLRSSEIVLLVEGRTDAKILAHLLSKMSPDVREALSVGRLQIRDAGGAGNVAYQFRTLRDSACTVHAVVDGDKPGRDASKALAKQFGDEVETDITILSRGEGEGEIEDLFDQESFGELLLDKFNATLDPTHCDPRLKFGQRIEASFKASGAVWSERTLDRVKRLVSNAVVDQDIAVSESRQLVVDSLLRALLAKLGVEPVEAPS